ncbi:MAG: vacuolar iron transporter family protein [Frankiaceae bacterium]|nr:vacuolar iron transporter family protein [Frankiaceae bacterium]MDQ1671661.1 vacuolar iron transporter family protein [Frankiaceae bacterium]
MTPMATSESAALDPAAVDKRSSVEQERVEHDHDHTHRDVSGGWLRAGTFGAMDGLVSNSALIAGFAGGAVSSKTVVLAGMAGLVAGAFSMATGEYTSVQSQNEAMEAEVDVERLELHRHPAAELQELADAYVGRGLEPELAMEVARQLSRDPEQALAVHAREELGVDPDKLPSPWVAAGSSFAAFAIGAFVPLLPYLLGATSILLSLILAGIALFGAGALVARFTSRSVLFSGGRQLLLGAVAAGATYFVGSLFQAGLG